MEARVESGCIAAKPGCRMTSPTSDLESLYREKRATIGIIGLGYVGMPLALAAWTARFRVLCFDVDREKVDASKSAKSTRNHFPGEASPPAAKADSLHATADVADLNRADAIVICVPTPLTAHREPDLSYVEGTAQAIAPHL